MSWTALLEFLVGLAIIIATLADVFASVLVPGPTTGWIGVAKQARTVALHGWRARQLALRRRDRRLSSFFGPLLFLFAFLGWLFLLLIGFGLMFDAASGLFDPPFETLSQAMYVAGSSILTLGVSEVDAHGAGRWLILWAGLSGFSIITATVTFILQVQSAFHQREWQVLTLRDAAGRPGSGIALLETYARLGMIGELPNFFGSWRNWSAAVLHSHAAHPILGYFHSIDDESDWLSALTIVLDAATLTATLTDGPARGSATLMQRTGARTAASLCGLYDLDIGAPEPTSREMMDALKQRLALAGYGVRDDAAGMFARMRADYSGPVAAIAAHLGTEPIELLPNAATASQPDRRRHISP